jgi:hypothetical protein
MFLTIQEQSGECRSERFFGEGPPHYLEGKEVASMWQLLIRPSAPLVVFAVLSTAALCAYVTSHIRPSDEAKSLIYLVWSVLLLMWIEADARRRRCLPFHDFAFLAGLAFPLSVIWYCFWSRGWSGIFLMFALLAPWLLSALFWAIA